MKVSLDEIKLPIKEELSQFGTHFKKAIASKVPLLDKISYYIVKTKGKQFRPLISLLSAKVFGPINEHSFSAATMVELLHTATLVHDDVVDDSEQRRGFFSINALWKNKIAVLVGDYLLSRGLLVALERDQFSMLKILSQAVTDMSEGELLQLEKARRLDINEEIYYRIIRQKTASLIAASVSCGVLSTNQDPEMLKLMHQFGSDLGMAFQIKDDLMDLSEESVGKPRINDIKEKKMTLPLIVALKNAPQPKSRQLINQIRANSEDPKVIQAAIRFILDHNGVVEATKSMIEFRDKALISLKTLPDNDARASLEKICYFVTERDK
ncbi:MAG: polyprenyl synthetase family protein [Saprospiraceae bacterium]|nr:polyprenyl synthetase family protein [Candidatus Vicinibacter affinis]MBK8405514.1 polyprenyl synthetase family protein [Candidatus Vicinibacter affinis]MBK8643255.1 polyprenyl synthetase family protein [Candidatus Vicinibacter affinis]MBK9641374.1 polyprenyl synthetase family protein [Candidatus Vicinibacter affinis]